MILNKTLKEDERLISINYNDMETLLSRKTHITNTINNALIRQGKNHTILDDYISMEDSGACKLNYIIKLNLN